MLYRSYPPISFALGMFSACGSPPFLALVFDDGAAVSLHSVRGLMARLNIRINASTLFDVLQSWEENFQELQRLVTLLAYDDEARGYRGSFVDVTTLVPSSLLPNPRQVFRVGSGQAYSLPPTVVGFSSHIFQLPPGLQDARPNLALAAVVGSIVNETQLERAHPPIAGYILTLELGLTNQPELRYNGYPGTVILGPLFIPTEFLNDFTEQKFCMAMMSNTVQLINFEGWNQKISDEISDLSRNILILPGDIVLYTDPSSLNKQLPPVSAFDVIEASNEIFGKIIVNIKL